MPFPTGHTFRTDRTNPKTGLPIGITLGEDGMGNRQYELVEIHPAGENTIDPRHQWRSMEDARGYLDNLFPSP